MIRFAAALIAATTVAAVSLAAAPAFAATAAASGTIQLNSTVAQTCSVAVTDAGTQLNILTGSNAVTVGSVVETCNDGAGYQISVSSANGGTLKSSATGAQPISYTPIYDGQSSGSSVNVVRSSAQFNKTATVAVTVPANAQAIAGSYTDTLTITIQGR